MSETPHDTESDDAAIRDRCVLTIHNALVEGDWAAITVFEALLALSTHCWFLMYDGHDDDTAREALAEKLREFADDIEAGQSRVFIDIGQALN